VAKRAPATTARLLYRGSDATRELSIPNPAAPYRTEYRRDFGRLIHSPAFRRLQGKTQLFPSTESEFFRNRLTHSLEVAQIAKGIAATLNHEYPEFRRSPIDLDVVETAALAHDLGHPPFGHIGESALDKLMMDAGGFEGNAQTLRILTRLEKKHDWRTPFDGRGNDARIGLNLTHRTLAAILKYDHEIPIHEKNRAKLRKLEKGYYKSEADLVARIKKSVCNATPTKSGQFQTLECQIMDIADDIAYSTYDLEDALKGEFITPLEMVSDIRDTSLVKKIADQVAKSIPRFGPAEVARVLLDIFAMRELFDPAVLMRGLGTKRPSAKQALQITQAVAIDRSAASTKFCSDGYQRTQLTSSLVDAFMAGVQAKWNRAEPALSTVWLDEAVLAQVEVLKHYTFEKLIMSPRIKLVEFRGTDIVEKIFGSLASEDRKGFQLLPGDYRHWYEATKDKIIRRRVVCDFVAGMTDRYAFEFYDRLMSSAPETFFKPH
jgi:dGTPase